MSVALQFAEQTWDGIYTTGFTLQQVRRLTARLTPILLDRNLTCLISYDTRFMADLVAQEIYQTLNSQGVAVLLAAAPAPLPAIYFALEQQEAGCALVVTAGNRPYWYNGLVLIGRDMPLLFGQPGDEPAASLIFPPGGDMSGVRRKDLRDPYLEALRSRVDLDLIRRASLTIIVDAMNGTCAGYLPAIIAEGGQTRAIEINKEADPLFGRTTPMPGASGLNRLRKLVRESDSHVGLAFSPDGSALGVVDKNGDLIAPAEITLLLAAYLSRQYRQKGLVTLPPMPDLDAPRLKAALAGWEKNLGLALEVSDGAETLITQPRPGQVIGSDGAGRFVIGNRSAHPDALYTGLMLIELISRNAGNLLALLEDLRKQFRAGAANSP